MLPIAYITLYFTLCRLCLSMMDIMFILTVVLWERLDSIMWLRVFSVLRMENIIPAFKVLGRNPITTVHILLLRQT